MKNKIRIDGRNKITLVWLTLLTGLFGLEYFYVGRKELGFAKLGFSWVGATVITLAWVIYGSNPIVSTTGYGGVVSASWIGAAILFISLIWSFINLGFILVGKFRDNTNTPINAWNSSYQEWVEYLIKGEQ
ncbi:TM2 domain-containing membrane protein YozV [Mycoplasmoides fastidiosum]|uniref:TM2 domain-containing membrane protein YozV n=1 Tax=Mycoplasmoides fastidiosum TaxID=92758 RepID=A0ABU0LZI4_9BACT|nr:NINE protein [Mycoplasmoides fastidiosum]MDQ0514119.1 TM2 domain-containing membrane protein YozV [Mycoplasmoides fastidiosum]UUD37473.1 NINE protein [Mycoplasmoides fastidiosum]